MAKSLQQITNEHFTWFNNEIARESNDSLAVEPTELNTDKYLVWQFWTKELHTTRRKLESVSLQEAQYEAHIITYFQLQTHIYNQSLTYPFKNAIRPHEKDRSRPI